MEAPFIDLVNSNSSDWHGSGRRVDRLLDPAWVDAFLSKWGLQVSREEYPRLQPALNDLRNLLVAEVKRVQEGQPLSPEGSSRLDSAISAVGYRRYVSGGEIEVRPEKKDSDWVVAQVAESFVGLLAKGDLRRLKTCANPDCGWLFYDDSRAMSRVWCESQTCGNLMKVRRFRERKKQNASV